MCNHSKLGQGERLCGPSCSSAGLAKTGKRHSIPLPTAFLFHFLGMTHRSGRYTTQNDLHMENREVGAGDTCRGEYLKSTGCIPHNSM